MKKPILHYCKPVNGWLFSPYILAEEGEEEYYCSFVHRDGFQIIASVEDDPIRCISISLCAMKILVPENLSAEEWDKRLRECGRKFLKQIFGDRLFNRSGFIPGRSIHYSVVLGAEE